MIENELKLQEPFSQIQSTTSSMMLLPLSAVWKILLGAVMLLCQSSTPSGTDGEITESLIFQVKKNKNLSTQEEDYESSARGQECRERIISVLSLAAEPLRPELVN